MLTTIRGTYKNGQVFLEEKPNVQEDVQVIVTFLEKKTKSNPKSIRLGSLKGLIEVPDDFDEPLDDLKDYMY